jgi:hypothetical protein
MRQQALRTIFGKGDGAPVQVIAPPGGFGLPVEDLSGSGSPAAASPAAVRRRTHAFERTNADLGSDAGGRIPEGGI